MSASPQVSLDEAEAAFKRGDFVRVRELLAKLAIEDRSSGRGQKLARATSREPLHLLVLAFCFAGLCAIALRYVFD